MILANEQLGYHVKVLDATSITHEQEKYYDVDLGYESLFSRDQKVCEHFERISFTIHMHCGTRRKRSETFCRLNFAHKGNHFQKLFRVDHSA